VAQHDNQGTASGAPGERGAGPTREGATGSGIDGIAAGAAIVLTLYGLAVIVADVFHQHLVPDSGLLVAAIMIGCMLLGGVLGGVAASRSER
jgi:hypothetical protein